MLAAKLLFIDSYYFLLVQLLNDLYQQSLFVCSCSKRAQGSAIKHQQGINMYTRIYIYILLLYAGACVCVYVSYNIGIVSVKK